MIASDLLAVRHKMKLTAAQMARALHTPRTTYQQWESGARRIPGVVTVALRWLTRRLRWAQSTGRPRDPKSATSRAILLADGTLTAAEIARRLGVTEQCVRSAIWAARDRGQEVSLARSLTTRGRRKGVAGYHPPRTLVRDLEMAERRAKGETVAELAAAYRMSRQGIHFALRRAEIPRATP